MKKSNAVLWLGLASILISIIILAISYRIINPEKKSTVFDNVKISGNIDINVGQNMELASIE